VLVEAQGAKRAAGELRGVEHGVEKLGAASERSGRRMRDASAESALFAKRVRSLSRVLKYGAVAAGGGLAFAAIKAEGASHATEELGLQVSGLHRNFGLEIQRATEWAAVTQARGVQATQLGTSFNRLATAAERAAGGSKMQLQAFKALGITQKQLQKDSKNF